ncbi:MAG: 30S ribosome-binding factor RbfA [Anaeroplasmataceae bacterium]
MSITIKRLESLALRELALLLSSDSKNKKLKNVVITEIRITNDLSFMTVYYTSFSEKELESVKQALDESKGYLRSELAKKLKARKMPELLFKYDEALANGNKMNEIISSLNISKE